MNELVQKQESMPSNIATPNTLLEMAISKGADVDQLEKLMQLQERYDAKQAKSAFLQAMTKFQSEVPRITKSKTGHNFSYAPLADIVEQIKGVLLGCGLTYRFEQNHQNGIEVTCVLSHIDGHSEQTSMQAGADSSGSKNDVQAIGSTVQYLQRYTLVGALGLTTADDDIDGRLPFEGLSEEQQLEMDAKLSETKSDKTRFLKWAKVTSLSQINSKNFKTSMDQIDNAYRSKMAAKK